MESISERTTKERVEHSLQILGFTGVLVTDLGDGKISLSCGAMERNDICIARAAVQNVVGVKSVKTKAN